MKAILLAAGHGTRLQPLTNKIPKCLVRINEKPMLEYWFDLFKKNNITEVLININHFPDQVIEFISKKDFGIKVELIFEENLLGSLGTILYNKKFVKNEKSFFIFYADTLTSINLVKLYEFHVSSIAPFTMGLFNTQNPTSCGIAKINKNNIIVQFEEKPKNPLSNLANAGIYIMDTSLLNKLKFNQSKLLDIGYDLLPNLVNHMNGYLINEFLIDIGTHENLNFANNFVKNNSNFFT